MIKKKIVKKKPKKKIVKKKPKKKKRPLTTKEEFKKYSNWSFENMEKLTSIHDINYKTGAISIALSYWAYFVKKRDRNKCRHCKTKINIHAHHILPKAMFPLNSIDVNNGITLCHDCHMLVHKEIRDDTPKKLRRNTENMNPLF